MHMQALLQAHLQTCHAHMQLQLTHSRLIRGGTQEEVHLKHVAHHCQTCLPVSTISMCASHLARHCRIHSRASCTSGFTGVWASVGAGGGTPLPCAGAGASSSCEPVCAPRQCPLTTQHAVC